MGEWDWGLSLNEGNETRGSRQGASTKSFCDVPFDLHVPTRVTPFLSLTMKPIDSLLALATYSSGSWFQNYMDL